MDEKTVNINIDRYEKFIAMETRCKVLELYVIGEKYSISKKVVAGIIGFELPEKDNVDNV